MASNFWPLVLLFALVGFFTSAFGLAIHPVVASLDQRDAYAPARVPYVFPPPGTDPVADALRARRENGTLLALDGVLLNTDQITSGWNAFFAGIRGDNTIPGNMRELVILRIAVLNNAAYQWLQHESIGRTEGLTTAQLLAIRFTPAFESNTTVLGPELDAAMSFADWTTKKIKVPDTVFAKIKHFLNNQQLVELTMTTGSYNLVSRFLIALDVDGKANMAVPIPS